jgi:hypothetical protein
VIASIQSDIGMVLTVFGCFFGFAVGMAFLALRLICRKVRNDFRKEGGVQGWARKSAPKAAGLMLKRVIFRKW